MIRKSNYKSGQAIIVILMICFFLGILTCVVLNLQSSQINLLSKSAKEKIKHLEDLGYHVKNAKIRYIVAWKNKERDDECPVILPEIELERKHE